MDSLFRYVLIASVSVFLSVNNASGQDCTKTSVGLVPINQLGQGLYQGYQGGLYPNGSNQRPARHDSAGLAIARAISPLDSAGTVDAVNGKIVLLSIGMSNTTQEFSQFKIIADTSSSKNPELVIVDGAQSGQTAAIISNPLANFWTVVDQRLASASVTAKQVQVAWVKEADANPTSGFPAYAQMLQAELATVMGILKSRYPNIKIAYLSNRAYGGYATSTLNPEPYAYESGFSVQWLIEKQIAGDTNLVYSGSAAKSPWLAWGPYLWADGTTSNNGLTWQCSDFGTDGTHPSTAGRIKVAQLLLDFFKTDSSAMPWFLAGQTAAKKMALQGFSSKMILISNSYKKNMTASAIRLAEKSPSVRAYDLHGKRVSK